MRRELTTLYKDLLDCHMANLYSFYFKLFKYEQAVQNYANKDISDTVNETIDLINKAIQVGEKIYPVVGDMPELSMGFLTNRSTVKHTVNICEDGLILDLLEEDKASIDQTLDLTIHYSKTLALKEEQNSLSYSQEMMTEAFKKLQYVLQ